ncbi:MAG: GDSL-type esterase/lipase family protein, partial [Planctomycetes bacterium]|nr:GDSL-type esterase/lipase family protein [Planctomycetota bacterium]
MIKALIFRIFVFVITANTLSSSTVQEDYVGISVDSSETTLDFNFIEGGVKFLGKSYPYQLLAPKKIMKGEAYPLILFLHGAGERGNDNQIQKRHFPELIAKGNLNIQPCFVLAPQCPVGMTWADMDWSTAQSSPQKETPTEPMQAAIRSLQEVVMEYPIDLERIILTGLSMGGFGTWDLAMRYPYWFSAAVPICGGGDEANAHRLSGLNLQAWHGAEDRVVSVVRSQAVVKAIRELGNDVDYFELPNTRHDSWNEAYRRKEFLEFISSGTRDISRIQEASSSVLKRTILKGNERVVFFGDSITQFGAMENGYVDLLSKSFSKDNQVIFPAGISGNKVPDLLARMDPDVIDKRPTVVFVYIGINDVWHSQWNSGTKISEYEEGLREMVRRIHEAGSKVVLATPSVIGERIDGKNPLDEMLDEYADISRMVAREEGAYLCDLRRSFV